ncbi:MAG: formyltransferase family protein [Betaproteobacteria bacterium]
MTDQPLRIVLCTNGGLHGALVLDRLLASPRVRIAGIVRSTRTFKPGDGFLRGAVAYVRRCGVAYALYLGCVTALADALLCHARVASSVGRQARRHGIPVLKTRQINDAAGRRFVDGAAADLLVSAFFNQRIDMSLAGLPRHGAVNIHPSPLPGFRGVDPVFHATLRRADTLGVSVHRIAAEFDTGALLAREARAAEPHHSVFWSTAQSYDRGALLLLAALDDIAGGVTGTPQPPGGSYDSWPDAAQVAALRRQGGKLQTMRDWGQLLRGHFPGRETSR